MILLCCDVELQSFVCLNVVNELSIEPTICSGARASHCFIRYKKIFCTRHCTTNLQLELGARLTRGRCHNREPLSPLGARLTRGRCHNREPLFHPGWPKPQSRSHYLQFEFEAAHIIILYYSLCYIYTYLYMGSGVPTTARGQLRQAGTPQAAANRRTQIIIMISLVYL